ncbi:MAG: GGDEF domain-containing protein [Armatimonadota bacterium]
MSESNAATTEKQQSKIGWMQPTTLAATERKIALIRSLALLVVVLTLRRQTLQPEYARVFPLVVIAASVYILAGGLLPLAASDPRRFASVMVVADLIFATLVVQATGGMNSGYVALFYLPVLRASTTMRLRDALATACLAVLLSWYIAALQFQNVQPMPLRYYRLFWLDASLLVMAGFFGLLAGETRNYRSALSRLDEVHRKLLEQSVLVRELTIRDGLTGLYDRRYFDDRLNDEFRRAHRYNRPFSIVLLELNGLRRLNNARGTAAGDAALKRIADFLSRSVRASDLVARYGGDGFALLMPETEPEGAQALAERIRAAMAEDPDGLTISLGFASFPQDGGNVLELVREADARLTRERDSRRGVHTPKRGSTLTAAEGAEAAQP